jgi:hypothetical protein
MQNNIMLESIMVTISAELKVYGHKLGSFSPPLPVEVNPDSSPDFSSKAVCAACGEWL